jgi:hypothetical protein
MVERKFAEAHSITESDWKNDCGRQNFKTEKSCDFAATCIPNEERNDIR